MKQWKKSSRWRAARQKAIDTQDEWLWCKLYRMQRGDPVFGLPFHTTTDSLNSLSNYYFSQRLLKAACNSLVDFCVFAMPKPLPPNMGATRVRFVRPASSAKQSQ